jgi:hypothetical protein
MSEADKGTLIHEELAKYHSIEERRKNAKSIAEKIGCSEQWVYSEIKKTEAERDVVAKTLFDLFVARTDTYAVQKKDKSYLRIEKPLTVDLVKEHLNGKITVGIYNLDKENKVKWLCFDIDPQNIENPPEISMKLHRKCTELFHAKSVSLEASRYNDPSFHVWVFFEPEIPAYAARFLGEKVLEKCGSPNVELFPKQDKIAEDGVGNLMKIPLGLHQQSQKWSCFLNPQTFEPLPSNSLFEIHGCSLPERDIEEIRRMMEREKPSCWFEQKAEEKEAYKGEYPPCVLGVLKGVEEGIRNESAIRLASFLLNFCKVEPPIALTSLRNWNAKNKPPLEDRELEIVLQSTLRGGYNYGCDDPILKTFCNQEACLLKEKEPVEIRLTELRAELNDQPVKVKVQVVGESNKKICCRGALIECLDCGTQEVIDLAEPRNYKLLLERLRLGQNKFKQSLYSFHVCGCPKAKRIVSLKGSLDYRFIYCQDLLDPKHRWEERTYRTEKLVLIGEPKEAVLKKIKLEGIVSAFKRDDATIMVYKVEPLEKPVPSSMEGFDEYFKNNKNLTEDLDRTIEPYIRERPTEKLVASLVLHSPYQLIFEGRLTRGSIYAMFLGETKTGKSDILEWIEKNVGGEGVKAEAATRAGVAWHVTGEKNDVLVWGALPRCDKEIVLLDGMDKFDMEDLGKMREALASQELTVHMAVHGKALCRGRILASANPKKTVFARKYKTLAESIIELFDSNTTLVTRWDAFVPFKREDVEVKEIAKAKASEPKIPVETFRNHVFWSWSLEPEDVQFSGEAEAEIETVFETLETEYASDSNPLVHSEYKNVLARFSAAYAVLTHSVDGVGKVIVTKDHVEKAHDLLWRLLEAWEYNWYVAEERGKLEIDAQEMADLMGFLTDDVWKIFSAIAKTKGLERAVILTMIDASPRTVDNYLNEMKKKDLIQHAKGFRGGYELMDKGIIIYRKIMMAQTEKEPTKVKLPKIEGIVSIKDLEKPEKGKCSFCENDRVLYYQAEGFKGEWGLACQDCGEAIKRQFGENVQ